MLTSRHVRLTFVRRCVLATSAVTIFLQLATAQTAWQGTTTEWRLGSNWSTGVPSGTLSATIADKIHDPVVPQPDGTDTARTFNLELLPSAQLSFHPSGILIVHGSQLKLGPSSVVSLGTGRMIARGNITFFNEGTFQAGAGTLEFSGLIWECKSNSSFDPGTGTVIFNGTNQQVNVSSGVTLSFNNIQFLSDSVTISGTVVINGDCTVADGSSIQVQSGGSLTINGTFTGDSGSISGEGSVSLPVQLSSFMASATGVNAELKWRTETEVENYGFEVERRMMGAKGASASGITFDGGEDGTWKTEDHSPFTVHRSPWTTIGFVQGAGTSSMPREYSFVDRDVPPGRYAYRLKQIDFDGSFTYYGAAEIEIGAVEPQLSLGPNYPNPFNPSTSIQFTVPHDGHAVLAVYNMIGQRIATVFDGQAEGGRIHRVTFSAPSLPSGLYFYKLEFGNATLVQRMTLLK